MKKTVIAVSSVLALLFLATPHAFAHANLTGANPAGRSQIEMMPSEVWLEFDENLQTLGDTPINFLIVKDSKGLRLDNEIAQVAGARLYTQIIKDAQPGKISMTYRIVSSDGHPIEGTVSFTLLALESSVTPTPKNSPTIDVTKETQVRPTPSPSKSESNETEKITKNIENEIKHDFFHRHRIHFIEFGVGALLIGTWWIYERRKKNSPH